MSALVVLIKVNIKDQKIKDKEIINGNWTKGYQTPAAKYGYALAERIPGVTIRLN